MTEPIATPGVVDTDGMETTEEGRAAFFACLRAETDGRLFDGVPASIFAEKITDDFARIQSALSEAEKRAGTVRLPPDLHENTKTMLLRFIVALADKLRRAEIKYAVTDEWAESDWVDTLRKSIREHVEKGDPLDVAAYSAFAWHHGWSLAEPAASPPARSDLTPGEREQVLAVLDRLGEIEVEIENQTIDQYRDLTHRGDDDVPEDADLSFTWTVKRDREFSGIFSDADRLRHDLASTLTTSTGEAT